MKSRKIYPLLLSAALLTSSIIYTTNVEAKTNNTVSQTQKINIKVKSSKTLQWKWASSQKGKLSLIFTRKNKSVKIPYKLSFKKGIATAKLSKALSKGTKISLVYEYDQQKTITPSFIYTNQLAIDDAKPNQSYYYLTDDLEDNLMNLFSKKQGNKTVFETSIDKPFSTDWIVYEMNDVTNTATLTLDTFITTYNTPEKNDYFIEFPSSRSFAFLTKDDAKDVSPGEEIDLTNNNKYIIEKMETRKIDKDQTFFAGENNTKYMITYEDGSYSIRSTEPSVGGFYIYSDIGSTVTISKLVPTSQALKMESAIDGGTFKNVPKSSPFFLSYIDTNNNERLQKFFSDSNGIMEFEVSKSIKKGSVPKLYNLKAINNLKTSYSHLTDILISKKEKNNIVVPKGISFTTYKYSKDYTRIHFKKTITPKQLKSIKSKTTKKVNLDTITYKKS